MQHHWSKYKSILFPISTALSFLVFNSYLKVTVSINDYGEMALYFLKINLLFVIGLFGVEQVIIRNSELINEKLYISKSILLLVFSLYLVFIALLLLFEKEQLELLLLLLIIPIMSVVSVMLKCLGHLSKYYIIIGGWKLVSVIYMLIQLSGLVEFSIKQYLSVLFFSSIALLFFSLKEILQRRIVLFKDPQEKENLIYLYFPSMLSIIGYCFYDYFDRFVIKKYLSVDVFGDYFFVYTVVASPILLVSSYIATFNVRKYKSDFKFDLIINDIKSSSVIYLFFIIISLLLFLSFESLTGLFNVDSISKVAWLLIVILIFLKSLYFNVSLAYNLIYKERSMAFLSLVYIANSILVIILLGFLAEAHISALLLISIWMIFARLLLSTIGLRLDHEYD